MTPSFRELQHFAKVALEPGETRRLTFHLKREDLSYVDRTGRSVVEPGTFSVRVDTLERSRTVSGDPLRSEEPVGLHSTTEDPRH